jgi:hypothetical protein
VGDYIGDTLLDTRFSPEKSANWTPASNVPSVFAATKHGNSTEAKVLHCALSLAAEPLNGSAKDQARSDFLQVNGG